MEKPESNLCEIPEIHCAFENFEISLFLNSQKNYSCHILKCGTPISVKIYLQKLFQNSPILKHTKT